MENLEEWIEKSIEYGRKKAKKHFSKVKGNKKEENIDRNYNLLESMGVQVL